MADTSLAGIGAWLTSRLKNVVPHFQSVHVSIAGACAFAVQQIDARDADSAPARLRFGFESAHFLPNVPPDHKCRRMHGHSFSVEIAVRSAGAIESHLRGVYDALDRRCLNEIAGLENATSEQVARWIWNTLAPRAAGLGSVTVAETCTAR
ncbi:MAG: 6-carboxytetrahydropterin synthase, partial [Candidatus Hydrogenedentes bacterium]|nr:6-carboxytetrahydropterin synthase [Candidatus Hydrogenedentota bacterium]